MLGQGASHTLAPSDSCSSDSCTLSGFGAVLSYTILSTSHPLFFFLPSSPHFLLARVPTLSPHHHHHSPSRIPPCAPPCPPTSLHAPCRNTPGTLVAPQAEARGVALRCGSVRGHSENFRVGFTSRSPPQARTPLPFFPHPHPSSSETLPHFAHQVTPHSNPKHWLPVSHGPLGLFC